MRSLLIMAHGTPRAEANADIHAVAEKIRLRSLFGQVDVAFLDCNEPTIPDAIDLLAAAGATEIIAVPYFLHPGRHVVLDIPRILQEGMLRHPEVTILLGDYLGRQPELADVVMARANEAK